MLVLTAYLACPEPEPRQERIELPPLPPVMTLDDRIAQHHEAAETVRRLDEEFADLVVHSPSPTVRKKAAWALAFCYSTDDGSSGRCTRQGSDRHAAKALERAWLQEEDLETRLVYIRALGRMSTWGPEAALYHWPGETAEERRAVLDALLYFGSWKACAVVKGYPHVDGYSDLVRALADRRPVLSNCLDDRSTPNPFPTMWP